MRYLYHYSEALFDSLKTREKQGLGNQEKIPGLDASYNKHISFFLEPIPLDILPSIHHNKHPFYVAGKEVYEYKIPTINLGIMNYNLVESPEKTKARYDTSIDDDTYFELIDKVNIANKYIGDKISDIEALIDRFEGTTRNYFIKIPSYPDYEKMKTKYAPCVPHLMVYPSTGIVRYSSVTKKKFGSAKAKISNSNFLSW